MRQFDVFANPSTRSRDRIPFVVILQSHLLAASHTTLAAPLVPQDGRSAFTETSVVVDFRGAAYVVLVAELAAVEARTLRQAVGNLRDVGDDIRRALDRVFTGF